MNLVKAQELAKELSIPELQKYANGSNPEMMPPYIALGALQAKELMAKKMQAMQGAAQGEQPSVKEQVEQKAGLMALQGQQQQQAQQQMAQQMQNRPMPAPEGVPQPEPQPQEMPMGMAAGGITRLPVQFSFEEGGIIGYAGEEGSQVIDPVAEAQARAQEALARLRTYGLRQRQQDPEGYAAAEQENQQAQNEKAAIERKISGGPAGLMQKSMGLAVAPPSPANAVQSEAPPLSEADMAMRKAPVGLPAAIKKPPVSSVAAPQAPRPAVAPTAPAAPISGSSNISPDQNQLIAEEAARRKAFGIDTQIGAGVESRMGEQRKRFEESRPTGLQDLIRFLSESSQSKGLSGMGPAYLSGVNKKRADEAAFEKQMEDQQTAIEEKRRAEGVGRATGIGTGLEKSREQQRQAKEASERNLTLVEVANINAASANRPGETERMLADYERLKATNPAAAAERMKNLKAIGDAKSGTAGDRQDLAELKNLQTFYANQVDPIKGVGVSKKDKIDAAEKLRIVTDKIAAMAGIGDSTGTKATLPTGVTVTKIK